MKGHMPMNRFDEIAKTLAGTMPRRTALLKIAGIASGAVLGIFGLGKKAAALTGQAYLNCIRGCRGLPVLLRARCQLACQCAPGLLCGTVTNPICCPAGAVPNAVPSCNNNRCGFTCLAGFANCSGNPSTGCETNTQSNSQNCGGCGIACPNGQSCVNGRCQALSSCVNGIKDGQETDVDCGGPVCQPCSDFQACILNRDCRSGLCFQGLCIPT
jgi:hypothetical protein